MNQLRGLWAVVEGGLGLASAMVAADLPIDFVRDVQPILVDRCVSCHGPTKQKGKLRLDSAAETFRDPFVVVPGQADESEMFLRLIVPEDDEDLMPADKDGPLTDQQIELVRRWIEQGAPWPEGLVVQPPPEEERDPDGRGKITPSPNELEAIGALAELGVSVRPLAQNETWTMVSLHGLRPEDVVRAIPLLASVQTLEDVNLAGTAVTDDQLRQLAKLKHLVRLRLDHTRTSDEGLRHLAGLEWLQTLNLYNTNVTDAGLNRLRGLSRLERIHVGNTAVTGAGIAEVLPGVEINGARIPAAAQADSVAVDSP